MKTFWLLFLTGLSFTPRHASAQRNNDLFNYGIGPNKNRCEDEDPGCARPSFAQEYWAYAQCKDADTCTAYPNKFPSVQANKNNLTVFGWTIDNNGNGCKWCPHDATQKRCGNHRQSPIDLQRYPAVIGGPGEKDCPDWHWIQYKDDTCSFDDMKGHFTIERHALQMHIPTRDDGTIDCVDENGSRRFARLDYSKGFPDWWWLARTDISTPSQHWQEGVQYAAEVTLAHFYQIAHPKNEMGFVTMFMQDYPDAESWPYLDKLICQWREKEEEIRKQCGLPPAPPYGRCRLFRGQDPLTDKPSPAPTANPTTSPTSTPTTAPTTSPTNQPTGGPTLNPTASPTVNPTTTPTSKPTTQPTQAPTGTPSLYPTTLPTRSPTATPSLSPSVRPSDAPSLVPTISPPSASPTSAPITDPTATPTTSPTGGPTNSPTVSPTNSPTPIPTSSPTGSPTASPDQISAPFSAPFSAPSPFGAPSPFVAPSPVSTPFTGPSPAASPSNVGEDETTASPSVFAPSPGAPSPGAPSPSAPSPSAPSPVSPFTPTAGEQEITNNPTTPPSVAPTNSPTVSPTGAPIILPTAGPTTTPTTSPTAGPTVSPTASPTVSPTAGPTVSPTASPTVSPTAGPTVSPTSGPSVDPTVSPTVSPTHSPTSFPTASPTTAPTVSPLSPSVAPTTSPTATPTDSPTSSPTPRPIVFFNEIHYTDSNTNLLEHEFFEIAGLAGTDLQGWKVVVYTRSGSSSAVFLVVNLSGRTLADESHGYGFESYNVKKMPNRLSGLCLVDDSGEVVEFLSWEGTLTANGGLCNGSLSTDIGVKEDNSTPTNFSMQRKGKGAHASDFTWAEPSQASPGSVNIGQFFGPTPNPTASPSASPTASPSASPTASPLANPTGSPSSSPTVSPSSSPTPEPSGDEFVVDCNSKPSGITFDRMCFSSNPCCKETRTDTRLCWRVYDENFLGGNKINAACRQCCGLEVGPNFWAPPLNDLPWNIQCSSLNAFRLCKVGSCCDNHPSTYRGFCANEYARLGMDGMRETCHYCCSQSREFPPSRRALDSTGNQSTSFNVISALESIGNTLLNVTSSALAPVFPAGNDKVSPQLDQDSPAGFPPIEKLPESQSVQDDKEDEEEEEEQKTRESARKRMDTPLTNITKETIRHLYMEGRLFQLTDSDLTPDEDEDEDEYFNRIYEKFQRREEHHRRLGDEGHDINYENVEYWPYEWLLKVGTEYYFRYEGTQVVPPCRQFVHWRVYKDPIRVHKRQIDELNRLLAWRINPDNCEAETAGVKDTTGNRVNVARKRQYFHKGHRMVFCECQDWPSKFPGDKQWCTKYKEDLNYDRLYKWPYSFPTYEWLPGVPNKFLVPP